MEFTCKNQLYVLLFTAVKYAPDYAYGLQGAALRYIKTKYIRLNHHAVGADFCKKEALTALLVLSESVRSTMLSSREVEVRRILSVSSVRAGPGMVKVSSPRNRPVKDFTGEILPTVYSVMTVPADLSQ